MILQTDQATEIKYGRNRRSIPVSNSMDDIQTGYKFSLAIKKKFLCFISNLNAQSKVNRRAKGLSI